MDRFDEHFSSSFSDFEIILPESEKFNRWHDEKGRFTSAPGLGTGVGFRVGQGDITMDEGDLIAMRAGSAGIYMTGRTQEGQPIFTAERQALHDKIVADAVAGVPSTMNPTYYMLGGGPAAGKTTMLNSGKADVPDKTGAVHINADDVKAELPEYGQMIAAGNKKAAGFTHEESSYLAKRIQAAAVETSRNIVLDGTGDSSAKKLGAKIGEARKQGYKTVGLYATVPTQVAIDRMVARGLKTGRFVSKTVVIETHKNVSKVFPDAVKMFDEIKLFDTMDGARMIASGKGGKLNVLDQAAFDGFLAKGD